MTININKSLPDDIRERMVPKWFDLTLFPDADDEITLSEDEWKKNLAQDEYHILRSEGTEPPFINMNNSSEAEGIYVCRGCANPLFSSVTKYDSGSGWPSFFAPVDPDRIETKSDNRALMERTEVHCARCKGHLGHVFEDGPKPTGLRFCLNSPSLQLIDKKTHQSVAGGNRDIPGYNLRFLP